MGMAQIVVLGTLGGLVGAVIAVRLAQTIPQRMGLDSQNRPVAWWGCAYLIGALYGGLVAGTTTSDYGWLLPAFLGFGAATLALTLIDLDHQLIPNRVLFPSLGLAAALLSAGTIVEGEWGALLRGVFGAVAYFVGLLVVALVARGGFGMGDVKLALLLGLFLAYVGWGALAVGSILAILLGGLASIVLLLTRKSSRQAKFAYGPYLVVGAWIGLIWGQEIIDWYLG